MSYAVVRAVLERSLARGSARLVLIVIAEHAHHDGTQSWPGLHLLAKETLLSQRQVRRIIHTNLVPTGELLVEDRAGRTNLYTVMPGGRSMSEMGVTPDTSDRGGRTSSVDWADVLAQRAAKVMSAEPSSNRRQSKRAVPSPSLKEEASRLRDLLPTSILDEVGREYHRRRASGPTSDSLYDELLIGAAQKFGGAVS